MKILSITCYFDPDYIRGRVLQNALATMPDVELVVMKNKHRGALRYPEMLVRLLAYHLTHRRPDVYLLNFRGYELLPFILLLAGRKPVVFDENINPIEVVAEHRRKYQGTLTGRLMGLWNLFGAFYYWLLSRCRFVLADTSAHAAYTASLSKLPTDKYFAIPIGTDETMFNPGVQSTKSATRPPFRVFYYGSMIPLHGPQYVIEAAKLLKHYPDITFLLAGNTGPYGPLIEAAQAEGAHIERMDWLDFSKVPQYVADSAINVCGPFGNTVQSQYVINGKTYQFLASQAVALVGATQATSAFHDRDNSLVVPQADTLALADTIEWAYHHQDDLPRIAANGRALYEQEFSNAVIAQRLRELLDKLS